MEIEENTKGRVSNPYGICSLGRYDEVVYRVDPAESVAETYVERVKGILR